MLPRLPPADIEHRAGMHPKQGRYLPQSSFRAPDLTDLFFREPSGIDGGATGEGLGMEPGPVAVSASRQPRAQPQRMLIAPEQAFGMESGSVLVTAGPAPFPPHVRHVVGLRAKPEVRRVNASRVVSRGTIVEHQDFVRDRPTKEHPGDAVGSACPLVRSEASVSVSEHPRHPDPALAGSVHLRHEAGQNLRVNGGERGRIVNSHGDLLQRFSGQAPVGARYASGAVLYSTRRIQ